MRRKVGGQRRDPRTATPPSCRRARSPSSASAHIPEDRNKHGLVGPLHDRRQPRAQPLPPGAVRPARPPPDARRSTTRPTARRASSTSAPPASTCAVGHAVGRQPAEGHRGPGAHGRRQGAVRRPADRGARRRIDRVHPQADHRAARPGRRGAAGVGRARRDPLALRPHRRAVPWPARRRVRRRRRRPASNSAT